MKNNLNESHAMNHPIRVLQVATTDITIAKILLPLIARQRAEGYEVEIACANEKYTHAVMAEGHIIHTIAFSRKVLSIKHLTALLALWKLMMKRRYDIVHVHTPIASILGRFCAKITGVPLVIYTVHGFYFHERTHLWIRQALILIEKLMGRWFTDALFVVSEEDYTTAIKNGIKNQERVLCLNSMGVNVKRFSDITPDKNLRQSLGIKDDERLVGFVGRIVREKGVLELALAMMQVIKRVPSAKLIIIGDTLKSDRDRATKAALVSIIRDNGLEKNIVFTGFRDDIPELLSILDLFALPSYREGMPVTILEAMASGLPVIATNIRGCREEVVDGKTGLLVPVGDINALARGIIRMLSNIEQSRKIGALGRKRVLERYDENCILNKQINAYKKLIVECIGES